MFCTECYNTASPSTDQGMYLNIFGIVNEKIPYLLQYWMKFFPLNLALKCEKNSMA
jgi:hypothetical protein